MQVTEKAKNSFAIIKRHSSACDVRTDRERWWLLSTQTARYDDQRDIFDSDEILKTRERLVQSIQRANLKRRHILISFSVAIVGLAREFFEGLFLPLIGILPPALGGDGALLTMMLIGRALILLAGLYFVVAGFRVVMRLHNLEDDVRGAFDPATQPRQLYLNAGKLRFGIGDDGLIVDGDTVEARHKWREFRDAWILGADGGSHIRLNVEKDRRTEFIIIPRARFLDHGRPSWQTFTNELAEHVHVVAARGAH